VLILLLSAGLLSAAIGRLAGLGFLPMTPALWDTAWILDDRSLLGSFAAGLVGYRASPSLLEVVTYAGYLAVVGSLLVTWGRARAGVVTPGVVGRAR
jgi:high-affinity iron transporter